MSDAPHIHAPHNPLEGLTKPGNKRVWLIGGVLGAGVLGFLYFSRGSSGSSTSTTTDALPETSGSGLTDSGGGGSSGTDSGLSTGVETDNGSGSIIVQAPDTSGGSAPAASAPALTGKHAVEVHQASWIQKFVADATSRGISATVATQTAQKYLDGGTLTYHQAVVLNSTLANVGASPWKTPPLHVAAAPKPPAKKAVVHAHPAPHPAAHPASHPAPKKKATLKKKGK